MKDRYYKDQSKQNYKFILIVLFVLVFILLFMLVMLNILKQSDNEQTDKKLEFDNLTTVKEVIEYYESEYISENESKEKNLYMDYYLVLKYLPYNEDKTSNEQYYNDLLRTSARVIGYRSFSMIDNKNKIKIKVICEDGRVKRIIINDIEDYFIYMDSQIALETYEELPITDFSIESSILQECLNNSWNIDTNFGERNSIYDNYYIYQNLGLKVRYINSEIFNIVFDTNYNENVINGLFPGIDLKSVRTILGNPTFESEDNKIIGYKGKNIYIFFTDKEISVYRNLDIDTDDFFELTDDFLDGSIDLLEFMNQLTYLWPDYSDYDYTASSVFIAYPLKGIEIKLNYDDTSGILVYNNIKSSLTKVGRYLENTQFVSRLKIDSIFEYEKRRVNQKYEDENLIKEYNESLDEDAKKVIGESLNYDIYPERDSDGNIYSIKFISRDDRHSNRELNDGISSYLWIDNDTFVYSKQMKGIYLYNLTTGKITRIESGNKNYTLKGYEDGILKYDNEQIDLQY